MAIGCPIVLTSGCGYDDYFRSDVDGLMVPPGSAEPLSRAVVRLLESEDLRARFASSASEQSQEYDLAVVAPKYLGYFEQMADAR